MLGLLSILSLFLNILNKFNKFCTGAGVLDSINHISLNNFEVAYLP